MYTGMNQDTRIGFGCAKQIRPRNGFGRAKTCHGREGLKMDVTKILAELKAEREQIEEAILSLERLARGRGPRRGRPPNWMAEIIEKPRRGRPPGSKNKVQATNTSSKTQAVAS